MEKIIDCKTYLSEKRFGNFIVKAWSFWHCITDHIVTWNGRDNSNFPSFILAEKKKKTLSFNLNMTLIFQLLQNTDHSLYFFICTSGFYSDNFFLNFFKAENVAQRRSACLACVDPSVWSTHGNSSFPPLFLYKLQWNKGNSQPI
jgi:hypothetical protein